MTTSLSAPAQLLTSDVEAMAAIHQRRSAAALLFAQETMNHREQSAALAFADYYEATVEYQILWSAATKRARTVAQA